jgi:hypothetical protein
MYRNKGLMFIAMVSLLLSTAGTWATTYYWHGDDALPYTTGSLWTDAQGTGGNALTDPSFWSYIQDDSSGANFIVTGDYDNILINGDPGTVVFDSPFTFSSTDANDNSHGFKMKRENSEGSSAATYTFNDMRFQGTLNLGDTLRPFNIAGNWKLTGPTTIMARAYGGTVAVNIPAFIDGSRIDTYRIQFRTGTSSNPGSNTSNVHLQNGNNAFFGEWILTTQMVVDTAGALGDADVTVIGSQDMPISDTDANIASYRSGLNSGILRLSNSAAISPTAQLTLFPSISTQSGRTNSKLILDSGVNATVRKFIVDGVAQPAATYSSTDFPGRIEGTGTITTTNEDATAVLTMACTKGDGGPAMTGDTCLLPRQGSTKAYKPSYSARIRAAATLSLGGANYTFAHWSGTGITNTASNDTTVLMDVSKTVTAVYTQSPGASTPNPANKAGNVSILTSLSWVPDLTATQYVFFGTSVASMTQKATLAASDTSVTNAQIGGPLLSETSYYWKIRTGSSDGPNWQFTTGKIKATTPVPSTAAMNQATSLTLQWTSPDSGATSFDVYFGTDKSAVEFGLVTPVNVAAPTTSLAKAGLQDGFWYYWRVDVKLGSKTAIGDIWSFRTTGIPVTINTDTLSISGTPPFTWTAAYDDASVAVFQVSNFNYGQQYDVSVTGSKRLAIWSTGDINFGGILNASAPDNGSANRGTAGAGGYVGGEAMIMITHNTGDANYPAYRWFPLNSGITSRNWWERGDMNFWRRRFYSLPHADANCLPKNDDTIYGPGRPYAQINYGGITSPTDPWGLSNGSYPKLKTDNQFGQGASYGGSGGIMGSYDVGNTRWNIQQGIATQYQTYTGSDGALPGTYGQKEVYELWGGSGGSGSQSNGMGTLMTPNPRARGGAGGGGAVEMYAVNGSLTLTPSAQVLVKGGSAFNDGVRYNGTTVTATGTASPYPGGGGSGGSIRLIAKTNLSVGGALSAKGGDGADAPTWSPTTSYITGAGGGGRIALYKGGSVASSGTIDVSGGEGGMYNAPAQQAQIQSRMNGGIGTVYGLQSGNGALTMITQPHDPIPTDGTGLTDANNVTIQWRPAIGSTTMNLYFGTTQTPPLVQSYSNANGLRAQKSYLTGPSAPAGTTYYWRVECNGVMGPLWSYKVLSYEARTPVPASGATAIDVNQPALSWSAGDLATATSWDVYFGTDKTAVANATTSTPVIFVGNVTTRSKVAALLKASTTYYWRVDERNGKVGSPFKGLVWNFTTRDPIVSFAYADLNNDGRITFVDFALMASNWKKCNLYAGCP